LLYKQRALGKTGGRFLLLLMLPALILLATVWLIAVTLLWCDDSLPSPVEEDWETPT
jgi:hypothetical protein